MDRPLQKKSSGDGCVMERGRGKEERENNGGRGREGEGKVVSKIGSCCSSIARWYFVRREGWGGGRLGIVSSL